MEQQIANCRLILWCLGLGLVWTSFPTWARPEFAVKVGQNRCTACHYSPAGGGPKNLDGKHYGSGGYKLSAFAQQPYAGADVKMLYYLPERHTETKGGMGIMAVNIYGSFALQEEGQSETRIVAEQNLGGFVSGPRQLFLRWQTHSDLESNWKPQHILLGRVIPAFGLMSDEHRNLVRMQTNTTWNQGLESGAMISDNPYQSLHYDLAIVNSQKNQGQSLGTGYATQFGTLLNLRYMSSGRPFLIGASGSYHEPNVGSKDAPTAWTVYGVWSVARTSSYKAALTLLVEYAQAKFWNSSFTNTFVSDAAYATAVTRSQSEGMMAQLNYELNQRFTVSYKYDRLLLDRDFPGDVYQRHGLGVKHYFGPMMWGLLRAEIAEVSVPSEKAAAVKKTGSLDAIWALINVGI